MPELSEDPRGKTRTVEEFAVPASAGGRLEVTATLQYRKVDQFLINFLLGEDSGLTAPVVEMTTGSTASVRSPPDDDRPTGSG